MIDSIRTYIAKCPYLNEYARLNVDYLMDEVETYSVNESAGYNPIEFEDILGNQTKQFIFNFDSKLHWNSEIQNNIDNSKFFENFRNWLEENNRKGVYPQLGEYETPFFIGAETNGYIFATNADEAIYRIQCKLEYTKEMN